MSVRSESSSQLEKKLTITSCDSVFISDTYHNSQPVGRHSRTSAHRHDSSDEDMGVGGNRHSAGAGRGHQTDLYKHIPTCFERLFSPNGADPSRRVVYYVVWDWASKVTVISFNACNPLLITHFGDIALGHGRGIVTSALEFSCPTFNALAVAIV
jgi:hypothetical protein